MKFIVSLFSPLLQTFRNRRRGTVRTTFSILSIVSLLGAAVITTDDVSYIRLESSDSIIEAGERFSVDVYAFAHVPVNAVDITIEFESNAVDVLEVDRGQSVLTIWTEDPIVSRDSVMLSGGTFRKGFLGEHKIATIDFVAKETGQSEFFADDILLLAGDGQGTAIDIAQSDDTSINLYIYDENTDPSNIGANVELVIVTDINGDGEVNLRDISSFMASWSSNDRIYDFNGDGKMTFKDFSIILSDLFFQ